MTRVLTLAGSSLAAIGLAVALVPAMPVAADEVSDTLVIGMTVGIDNPNIWAVNSTSEWSAVTLQYDMMLKFSDDDLSAAPSLATGCEPSDGNRTWTCQIRDDVLWSDGTPLTARDIAFSYRFVIDQGFPYFTSYFSPQATFEAPDDYTLVWKSPEPILGPDVPPWVYIVPEHIWSKYEGMSNKEIKQASTLPTVSSGPYIMTEAVPGQNWTFTRNPNFWGNPPTYEKIVFQLFSNQEGMIQALKSGDIQIADGFESTLLPAVEAIPDVAVQRVVADSWINLAFNFGGQDPSATPLPALQDVRVRQAIAMAIDKQAIVNKVYLGAATMGETIVRPLSVFWHLDIPDDEVIAYDPEAANALLDEAGYARGEDGVRVDPSTQQPLVIRMPTSNDTPGSEPAGQLIASFLNQVGIEVKAQPVSAGKVYDMQQSGDFDAYIWYWTGDPDPNYQLSVFTSDACGDLSDGCWQDPTYDALVAQQATTLDQTERQASVHAAQRYVYEQVPAIALAYPNALVAYRTDLVSNLTPVPANSGYLTPSYSYTSMVTATPVDTNPAGDAAEEPSESSGGSNDSATSEASSASSSGLPVWIWIALAAVIAAMIFGVVIRRRTSAAERPDSH